MKIISIIKKIAFVLLTILILHLTLRYLGIVFSQKHEGQIDDDERRTSVMGAAFYFSLTKPNSVDMVFVGSSHVYCGLNVNILNNEYGMNSIMLSTTAQTIDLSYYAIMEAINRQHPDTVVLDALRLSYDNEQTDMASRSLLSDLPNWSKAKYLAARETENPIYYYYPVMELHGGWWKTKLKDFLPRLLSGNERYSFTLDSVQPLEAWELIDERITQPIPSGAQKWLEKIIDLCDENGVKLVLYLTPFSATAEQQAIFNGLSVFAEERGIEFYNLLSKYEQVGIDPHTDFTDENHLNRSGQVKVTRYLAEHCLNRQVS